MASSLSGKTNGLWKPIFVGTNQRLFNDLAPALSSIASLASWNLASYPSRNSLSEAIAKQQVNLCFLDVGSHQEKALSLLGDLAATNPELAVVAVDSRNDPDLILKSLHKGASEFLFPPFSAEQIESALGRLHRLAAEAQRTHRKLGRIYCVMPGKGACGATTLACNLAFQIKRSGPAKVLLADLDALTGTIAFLLKLKFGYSFLDAIAHSGELDADLWKGLVTQCQGLDVMLPPENPVDLISEHTDPAAMLDYARGEYEAIVLDSHGPYGDWSVSLARQCDELLLVTTNELPALHCTQKAISYLTRMGVDRDKVKLVVNRYNRDVGLGRETIETALHAAVYHVLPRDYQAVQKALIEGKPIASGTKLGKGVEELAERLVGRGDAPKKRSLFSGIFPF